jgi:hypothetical protein
LHNNFQISKKYSTFAPENKNKFINYENYHLYYEHSNGRSLVVCEYDEKDGMDDKKG